MEIQQELQCLFSSFPAGKCYTLHLRSLHKEFHCGKFYFTQVLPSTGLSEYNSPPKLITNFPTEICKKKSSQPIRAGLLEYVVNVYTAVYLPRSSFFTLAISEFAHCMCLNGVTASRTSSITCCFWCLGRNPAEVSDQ